MYRCCPKFNVEHNWWCPCFKFYFIYYYFLKYINRPQTWQIRCCFWSLPPPPCSLRCNGWRMMMIVIIYFDCLSFFVYALLFPFMCFYCMRWDHDDHIVRVCCGHYSRPAKNIWPSIIFCFVLFSSLLIDLFTWIKSGSVTRSVVDRQLRPLSYSRGDVIKSRSEAFSPSTIQNKIISFISSFTRDDGRFI